MDVDDQVLREISRLKLGRMKGHHNQKDKSNLMQAIANQHTHRPIVCQPSSASRCRLHESGPVAQRLGSDCFVKLCWCL